MESIGSDDVRYVTAAADLAAGRAPAVHDHAYARAAFIVFLATWLRLGLAPSSLWIAQVAAEILLALALFQTARRFVDDCAAFLAGMCWLFSPLGLVYGGMILPDALALAAALIGVAGLVDVARHPGARPWGRVALAGCAFGIATSVKEPLVLALPLAALGLVLTAPERGETVRRVAFVSLIAAGTFALEYPFFAWWTGEWAYRHTALEQVYGPTGGEQYRLALDRQGLTYYASHVLLNHRIMGALGWLALAATLGTRGLVRDRGLLLLLAGGFFLYLQFGTTDFRHYNLVPRQPRYAEPILVPLLIPLGQLLASAARLPLLGVRGLVVLLVALGYQGISLARERFSESLYHSGSPLAVQEAQRRAGGSEAGLAIPDWALRSLPPDVRSSVMPLDSVSICRVLSSAPRSGAASTRASCCRADGAEAVTGAPSTQPGTWTRFLLR